MEEPAIQMIAAKTLAADVGITVEQALDVLEFQDRATAVSDALEDALGSRSGDLWFDSAADDGKWLKIGVQGPAPPAGPEVDKVTQILGRHGLQDHAELVAVAWTMKELLDAQARVDSVLEPLLVTNDVATGIDPSINSIVIDAGPLSAEQRRILKQATLSAGVTVRLREHATPQGGVIELIPVPSKHGPKPNDR